MINNESYQEGLVSVVIPTYKRSDMLYRAIDSVCSQTYSNIEVLVVNDNIAGDSYSEELVNKMARYENDKRVILVEQEKHINGAAARNVGIRKAKGAYIAFLDDDDWWEPEKIEHQKKYLDKLDETWGGVGCLMRHYRNDKLVYVSLPYHEGNLMFDVMTRKIGIGTGSPLMRRKAVDDSGYFDEDLLRHQDIQFFSYFCNKYKMGIVKEYLYDYDLGDAQNRPSPEKIKDIKEMYYRSVSSLIDNMTAIQKKKFYIMNDFEIGCAYWKAGDKKTAFPMILGILRFPLTLYIAVYRIVIRWLGTYFAKFYEKKYECVSNVGRSKGRNRY